MQIPMYDKTETNPSELLIGAMSDVASVSWYEAGTFVQRFEQAFASLTGVEPVSYTHLTLPTIYSV